MVPLRGASTGQGSREQYWRGNAIIQRLDDSAPLQKDLRLNHLPSDKVGGEPRTLPESWLNRVGNTRGLYEMPPLLLTSSSAHCSEFLCCAHLSVSSQKTEEIKVSQYAVRQILVALQGHLKLVFRN